MTQSNQAFRHVIAALVTNEPGVLAQVASMFAARGFNIDSLVVGRTDNPEISRMTIVVTGDTATLEQVRKQLQKLVPVVKVVEYADVPFVERDMILVQVSTKTDVGPADKREEIITMANLFRAKVVDVSPDQLMIEMAGSEEKIEAFIELLEPYGIIELARTGVIAMRRGNISQLRRPAIARALSQTTGRNPDASNTAKPDIDPGDLPPG
ncbi:acetolactate synthase small subunit [Poriferisphaera sp. WC338]|uniref:acetolactate synthase small subunit n=1 Tax=Poriferisphaera sp. WC338 TaxID=3425129 RepID=UPI003D8127D1